MNRYNFIMTHKIPLILKKQCCVDVWGKYNIGLFKGALL